MIINVNSFVILKLFLNKIKPKKININEPKKLSKTGQNWFNQYIDQNCLKMIIIEPKKISINEPKKYTKNDTKYQHFDIYQ